MSTRARVLRALRNAAPHSASGEDIASELGISRVAVLKHIAALRIEGYVIDAHKGEGYRLRSAPDLPLPEEVAPHLTDPFWVRVEGGAETGSTNEDARKLAEDGAPEGTAVIAAKQLSGRGRLGRTWCSPEGGIYVSVVLRPPCSPFDIAPLPLVIAVGVARALQAVGARPNLKWPNDVRLEAGKVAGILLEMKAEGETVQWVVAGIGLNVRDVGAFENAGYVYDEAGAVGSAKIAAAVLDAVSSVYRQWRDEGFTALHAEFERLHALTGEPVTVRNATGAVIASGTVKAIDDSGRLVVTTPDGEQHVSSGEVTLRD